MDLLFLLFVTVLIAAGVVFAASFANRDRKVRYWLRNAGIGAAAFAFALLFFSSFTILQAKEVGVVTINGKPAPKVLQNGWNWKNPMAQVHKFDGAVQTEKYSSDKDDQGDPITVRLFTGSTARVNVTFQWKLEGDDNFVKVFLNYRDVDNLNTNVVKRMLQQALNEVFASYNPYAALIAAQGAPGTAQVAAPTYVDFQNRAMDRLNAELMPQGIKPWALTISTVEFDNSTQDSLNKLSQAIAQTQVAIQNEKTATAQADANNTLNSHPATGTTLTQLCIQATQKILEDGKNLPTGWNCFGASNVAITSGK